jgi:hypothetical protein
MECPVCRAHMPHALLQRMLSPDEVATGHPDPVLNGIWHKEGGSVVVTLPDGQDAMIIDDHVLHTIHMHREKRMRIVEAQAECGGLIQKHNAR